MIIARFKQRYEESSFAKKNGILKTRWVLDVGWFYVSLHYEVMFDTLVWRASGGYYGVGFTLRYWSWGREHAYYDGPHDSFSLGPLHFSWSNKWCEKCYRGE